MRCAGICPDQIGVFRQCYRAHAGIVSHLAHSGCRRRSCHDEVIIVLRNCSHVNTVDIGKLKPIIERASSLAPPLKSATKALAEVEGTAPFVGDQIIAKRDEALKHLAPLQSTFLTAEPALKALPQILGEGGKKKYLLAILNPGELRYSGGAPLSLAEMTARDGKLKFSAPADLSGLNSKGALLNCGLDDLAAQAAALEQRCATVPAPSSPPRADALEAGLAGLAAR